MERIRLELGRCGGRLRLTDCHHSTRSAYRFLPEFRESGMEQELVAAFGVTMAARSDQAVVSSPRVGGWHKEAVAFLRAHP
jgi:hypothetical protein